MFVLDRSLTRPPVPLGERLDEGPAVSHTRMHVAWTAPGQREMFEADIVYADGVPALANRRLVLSYENRPATERLETQDFRPPDEKELLFTCYSGTVEEPFYFADLCGIDLARGKVANYTNTPEQYDEAEGVFPTAGTRWSRATATAPAGNGRSTSTAWRWMAAIVPIGSRSSSPETLPTTARTRW